jgi:hypothetical protein
MAATSSRCVVIEVPGDVQVVAPQEKRSIAIEVAKILAEIYCVTQEISEAGEGGDLERITFLIDGMRIGADLIIELQRQHPDILIVRLPPSTIASLPAPTYIPIP